MSEERVGSGGATPGGRGVTRRRFLRVGAAGLAGATLLGVAGCGGGQQGDGGGNGNNLVVALDQEPAILNQFIVGGDLLATANISTAITESPLQIMPDLTVGPQLADGMPEVLQDDPLVIEYKLKDGLTWSDGKPLTSADASWTYEQQVKEGNQILTRFGWEKVTRFETPDDLTVRITFSEPFAPYVVMLAGSATQILPKHVYEGRDFNKVMNDELVGSGPFRLREWKKGQSVTVERNENYWGEKAPLESITYRFIPDTNSLVAALQSGEVQFIFPPPDIGLLERLEDIDGAKVEYKPGTVYEHITFNVEEVDNLKIRQAVAYGINREQAVEQILKGQVSPLNSFLVPEQKPYATPAWAKYTQDQDKARQLVEEAKSEGASTTVTFSTTSDARLRETLQEVIRQQLEEVGITVEIDNSSADTFFADRLPGGDFQMGQWAWLATPDPSSTTLFASDQIPPKGQNYAWYKNDRVTELLKQSDKAVDGGKRADLLKQAQELIAEDLPMIPLYQRPEYYAWSEELAGPDVNPTIAGPFWTLVSGHSLASQDG